MAFKDGHQLVNKALLGLRRGECFVGQRVQFFVENQEYKITFVLSVIKKRPETDVRAVRDLSKSRGVITETGKSSLSRRRECADVSRTCSVLGVRCLTTSLCELALQHHPVISEYYSLLHSSCATANAKDGCQIT